MDHSGTTGEKYTLLLQGRGAAPGTACGPIRRNRPGLDTADTEGTILVAARAVPEDIGRVLAAAGTLTFGGALLSHMSLLSREFGKPSLAIGSDGSARLLQGEEYLVELIPSGGGRPVRLREGEIVCLDGDRGILAVPGGDDAEQRKAVRAAFTPLALFGREPAEERLLETIRPLLEAGGEPLLRFLLDAAVLYRVVPPGNATRVWIGFLESAAPAGTVRRLCRELARQVEDRVLSRIAAAEAELEEVREPDDLDRRVLRVEESCAGLRQLSQDVEAGPPRFEKPLAAFQAAAESLRRDLREQVAEDVRELLNLPDEVLIHRIGGLFQLLRRARSLRLDRSLTGPLQARLSRHLAEERARAGADLVVSLDRTDGARDRSLVGGKAAGLFQAGNCLPDRCRIPWGFVVTTSAYRLHLLGEPGEKIREAVENGAGEREISRRAKAAILGGPIPREVTGALEKALAGRESTRLAIRSSGTMEDGPAGSLAGQYDTYLGVSGRKEIHDRIRRAWASLWNHQAIRLLAGRGIAPAGQALAVLVQEMVETRCAGVLFSREPSGKPDTLLVNANWGLGEGISQGETAGDLYWVRRSTGELLASETGNGGAMIVLDPDRSGTLEKPIPRELRGTPCLTQENLERLAELARNLEQATGRGQDVEFGFTEGGELAVFQVRRLLSTGPRVVE